MNQPSTLEVKGSLNLVNVTHAPPAVQLNRPRLDPLSWIINASSPTSETLRYGTRTLAPWHRSSHRTGWRLGTFSRRWLGVLKRSAPLVWRNSPAEEVPPGTQRGAFHPRTLATRPQRGVRSVLRSEVSQSKVSLLFHPNLMQD